MSFDQFKVLTFDVVGTLIDFEKGVLDSIRRLGGSAAKGLSDEDIFEPYKQGRDLHPGRSSQVMPNVYLHVAKVLGRGGDEVGRDRDRPDVPRAPACEAGGLRVGRAGLRRFAAA